MELEERAQKFLEKISDNKRQIDESVTDIRKAINENDAIRNLLSAFRSKATERAEEIAIRDIPEAKRLDGVGFKLNGQDHQFVAGVPEIKKHDFKIKCILQKQRERGRDIKKDFEVSGSITLSLGALGLRIYNESPLNEPG
jgi:hypothetical protein